MHGGIVREGETAPLNGERDHDQCARRWARNGWREYFTSTIKKLFLII
jgi:hypothetical protein